MDTKGYIDITTLDVRKLVDAAFEHSRPQGMGFIHHRPGPLTDEEFEAGKIRDGGYSYDYVRGRSMKLHLRYQDDHVYWQAGWYDHLSIEQFDVLIAAGMSGEEATTALAVAIQKGAE